MTHDPGDLSEGKVHFSPQSHGFLSLVSRLHHCGSVVRSTSDDAYFVLAGEQRWRHREGKGQGTPSQDMRLVWPMSFN